MDAPIKNEEEITTETSQAEESTPPTDITEASKTETEEVDKDKELTENPSPKEQPEGENKTTPPSPAEQINKILDENGMRLVIEQAIKVIPIQPLSSPRIPVK